MSITDRIQTAKNAGELDKAIALAAKAKAEFASKKTSRRHLRAIAHKQAALGINE